MMIIIIIKFYDKLIQDYDVIKNYEQNKKNYEHTIHHTYTKSSCNPTHMIKLKTIKHHKYLLSINLQ